MAQHKSAEKRIRRNGRRDVINTARKSRIRSSLKKVENLIATSATDAVAALQSATKELQKGVSRGVIHKNTASRRLSRLTKRAKKAAA